MSLQNVLAQPIEGVNLNAGTLGAELGDRPTLMVFLRHLGCIFCREMVKDIRKAAEADPGYPPVLFFYQGTVADGQKFFADYYPTARAVADAPKAFYTAAGIVQGGGMQMFSPRVWMCGLRATAKGNTVGLGRIIGDPWMMPGVMLVRGGEVLWRHEFMHAGDHPDFPRVPEVLRSILAMKTTTGATASVVGSNLPIPGSVA